VGAYNLNREERRRRDWIHDIRFAVSWCPGDPEILDALAQKLNPGKFYCISRIAHRSV